MIDLLKTAITGQYAAALAMLKNCVAQCPQEQWESKVANDTFRQVAYHTLFFVDLYLSPSMEAFTMRELNLRGGDERQPVASQGLNREDTLAYVTLCQEKVVRTLSAETAATLGGPTGFPWLTFSRAELHVYSVRHIQHHTGALSAFLRRLGVDVPWTKSGGQ
jgi:uncharacterized damage-inducible protein DinB